MKLLITGGAGYIGAMLVDQFSKRGDVEKILVIDKDPAPDLIAQNPKLEYIQTNLSDEKWQTQADAFRPDVVIHTAWQIRELYGKKELQHAWNVGGSDAVFDFVFRIPSVKKLIHFSTVASYGAYSENTIEHLFTETEPFRVTDYRYAEEKRIAEEHLHKKYTQATQVGNCPQVFVVRPASITGVRGRYMMGVKFGLQSALSGQLKGNTLHRIVSLLLSVMPATKKWCRQFVHEDDVCDIIATLSFDSTKDVALFEIFNLCPPGSVVRASDMAKAVGKKIIRIHPQLIRLVFFLAHTLSFGRIPTSRGVWKAYSYPIAVDGSKVTKLLGYSYQYAAYEAFTKKVGRYLSVSNLQIDSE